jgi:hypothetical protein
MMTWIGTPVPVEEIVVLVHLILVRPLLTRLPIGGPNRDGQIERRRLEGALLAD